MIFKQLFEKQSYTYTYLLGCPTTGQAILLDPVLETVERDLDVIKELGLTLHSALETHIHADHITGGVKLRALTDCKIAGAALDNLSCRDIGIKEGEAFKVGDITLHPLFTPGHTATHHAYLIDNGTQKMLFSGDALLIEACGRTDFQEGDAGTLYDSVKTKFFTLPGETLVYPGHDYDDRTVSTIAQERQRNPRLTDSIEREQFIKIMDNLDLPYPHKIEYALPGNKQCGQCPDNIPPGTERLCEVRDQG